MARTTSTVSRDIVREYFARRRPTPPRTPRSRPASGKARVSGRAAGGYSERDADLGPPLGAVEALRYPTYRGTEEVVYLRLGRQYLGLRRADGGQHRYYEVGIEHLALFVDTREEVDQTYQCCLDLGVTVHFPPEEDSDEPGYWALFVFDPDGMRIEVAHWPGDPASPPG